MRTETSRENYLDRTFGDHDPALAKIRRGMQADGLESMALGPHEARLLQFLVRLAGVRTVVEIGTLHGYSALALARALPADGHLITIEVDPARSEIAHGHVASAGFAERVEFRVGPALDVLATLDGEFDAVFIDANKREYPLYLDWAGAHVRRGGLVIGDNTFLWGAVYGESSRESTGSKQTEAMIEFNRRLSDPARWDSTMIPTVEGLTVARKLF